jgi:hypothetical protein
MVMRPKRLGLAGLLASLVLIFAWSFWPREDEAGKAAVRLEAGSQVPAIGLDRLRRADATRPAPGRDLFRFGQTARFDSQPVPTPVIRLEPRPETLPPVPEAPPTPTPWPALNVSLIGIVDNGAGPRIGSFVKDGDILLVGQPGQVLANAFRVVRIGTESAEIEELGSGRSRRLPLKN